MEKYILIVAVVLLFLVIEPHKNIDKATHIGAVLSSVLFCTVYPYASDKGYSMILSIAYGVMLVIWQSLRYYHKKDSKKELWAVVLLAGGMVLLEAMRVTEYAMYILIAYMVLGGCGVLWAVNQVAKRKEQENTEDKVEWD